MSKLNKILDEVEDLRQELIDVLKVKQISNPDVLKLSQKLDLKLNEYYQNYLKTD